MNDLAISTAPAARQASSAERAPSTNQSSPLEDYNAYATDTALREAVHRHGAGWADAELCDFGARTGSAEVIRWGFLDNDHPPQFHSHDRYGNRIDLVEYHDAYHKLMALSLERGYHARKWLQPQRGATVASAGFSYLRAQVDTGHGCPIGMTIACVPTLRLAPEIARTWLPKILSSGYDSRNVPFYEKESLTIGMGMTEKQGGTDVRANTTRAWPMGSATGNGALYELSGHKWFTSAPMCDAFLILAYTDNGQGCFLVPRWRPDGTKNTLLVQRLKNKVGNRSNASSEIELDRALGWMIGDETQGLQSIIKMVAETRFGCIIGSAAMQHQGVVQAMNHCAQRKVSGKLLIDQPLMRNVLADLQLEVEGALAIGMRVGEALDNASLDAGDDYEQAIARVGAPIGKYWVCKRTPGHTAEAMECLGGNGAIEDFITARLYRDAPINSIWEGSGNVQVLDVLRAVSRTPFALEAWLTELERARGADDRLDAAVRELKDGFAAHEDLAWRGRQLVDLCATTMQATQLVLAKKDGIADAFISTRLGGTGMQNYGCLPAGAAVDELLERADPSKVA